MKSPNPDKIGQSGPFLPRFSFSNNRKNSIVDVSGSLQSGVGATPQYQWSVAAKYPIEYNGSNWILLFGPQFNGVASQEANADPDSLSASFAGEVDFPFHRFKKKGVPISLSFDPVDYEFERKSQQEAVLEDGKPTLHDYQTKNTNLITSGQVQFVTGWGGNENKHRGDKVALNLNLGTEFGSALSRSVQNENATAGYSNSPLRAVGGADVYFDLPNLGKYPLLSVDGHYTVRSPFHPEPFRKAGVNDGNEFHSTQARHYVAVNLNRAFAKGANVAVQYRYGSLPPTFKFIESQVTIGFEVLLGK